MEQVIEWATRRGYRCYHTHSSRHSVAGFPDLVLLRARSEDPRLIFAELKRVGQNATPEQHAWLADLRSAGCEAYLWWPSDFEAIVEILR